MVQPSLTCACLFFTGSNMYDYISRPQVMFKLSRRVWCFITKVTEIVIRVILFAFLVMSVSVMDDEREG